MEQSKYLQLARQAKAENNSEDAKAYYNKVREEYPENGEAKFFYAYYSLYEGTNSEVPTRFLNLCKVVISSVKMVRNSEMAKEEQLKSRLVLQVHDELLIEAHESEVDKVKEILQYEMEHATELLVPLDVDMHTGKNWYEAK